MLDDTSPDSQIISIADFTPGIYGDIHAGLTGAGLSSIPVNGAATIQNTYRCCADPSGALTPLPAAVSSLSASFSPHFPPQTFTHPARYPDRRIGAYVLDVVVTGPMAQQSFAPNANGQGVSVVVMYSMDYNTAGTGNNASIWYDNMILVRSFLTFVSSGTIIFDLFWSSTYDTTLSVGRSEFIDSGALEVFKSLTSLATTNYPATFLATFLGVSFHSNDGRGFQAQQMVAIPAAEQALTNYPTHVNTFYSTNQQLAGHNNGMMGGSAGGSTGFIGCVPRPSSGFLGGLARGQTDFTQQFANYKSNPTLMVSHQGRLVVTDTSNQPMFDTHAVSGPLNGFIQYHINDYLYYTAVDDYENLNGAREFVTFFAEENVSGVGAMCSITADELLIIKHRGGGVTVRGDLDSPTIVRMPGIASTNGVISAAVNTPIGAVYGTKDGVYAWSGGIASVKLSPQMGSGFFWDHIPAGQTLVAGALYERYSGSRGRFGYLYPWVLVPNNYLYDTQTKGWWRLMDPADRGGVPYNCYGVDSSSGTFVAVPYKLNATQDVAYDTFTPENLATSYSWQSQPLVQSRDKRLAFIEQSIVVSCGANTNTGQSCAITMTGYDYKGAVITSNTNTITFTGAAGAQPQVLISPVKANFTASYVTIRIVMNGNGGVAAKLHALNLRVKDDNLIPRVA